MVWWAACLKVKLTCCLYQLIVLRCSTKSGGDKVLVIVQGSWRLCSCGGRGAGPLRCVSPHLPVFKPAQQPGLCNVSLMKVARM